WTLSISANRPIERSAGMQFIWPRFAERERDLANKLGLPLPLSTVELPTHLQAGTPLPDLTLCQVKDADQAADVCLMVLQQVFACYEERWLWITDIAARDHWPNPLPKPAGWPPLGSASGEA